MIHNREQLLSWLTKAAKDDILLLNALNDSGTRVELLGTFNPLPGGKKPGWLIRLTTRFDREELVAIVKDHLGRPDHIFFAPGVDWSSWRGPNDDVLIGGDKGSAVWSHHSEPNAQRTVTGRLIKNGPGNRKSSNTSKFHRIERCTGIYTQKDRSARDSTPGKPMDKRRGNPPNVPPSTPPVIV